MPRLARPNSVFGLRLREARLRLGIAQDKLGVMIGMDESSSSARMSRYETGTHEPPFSIAERLAGVLEVPVAYFYCPDNALAEIILCFQQLDNDQRDELLVSAKNKAGLQP